MTPFPLTFRDLQVQDSEDEDERRLPLKKKKKMFQESINSSKQPVDEKEEVPENEKVSRSVSRMFRIL